MKKVRNQPLPLPPCHTFQRLTAFLQKKHCSPPVEERTVFIPGAAITNHYKLGGLKQQKLALTVLEVRSLEPRVASQDL